jgi:hypothetical protein
METVFIRSLKRKGHLFNTLATPEQTPTGMNIVIVGVIAVDDSWVVIPLGDTVLLTSGQDATDEQLAERYPVKEVQPRKTVLIPVNAPPGLR